MARVVFAVWMVLYLAPTVARAEFLLVEGGQPKATIVVAVEPSAQAAEASQTLQEYVERISGARLEIRKENEAVEGNRVLVGHSEALKALGIETPSGHTPQMNEEGFVIKVVGNDLVLAGNEEWKYRGTAFAVYDLLEQDLGCRWYSPGPYGEVIPKTDTIRLGQIDRVERPSFRVRDIWYSGWLPATEDDVKWRARWYDLNKLTALELDLPRDDSVKKLAPAEKYLQSHPEIYALNENGERQDNMLCMSEPEAVRIAAETIKQAFRDDPEMLSFGFGPPDGHPRCYCPRCKSYFPDFTGKGYGDPSLSEVWFQFVNKVAQEVYKEFPERWLLTNGYANRVRPVESVKPLSPNIGLQSAMLSTCTFHYAGDPKCWQRIAYKQVLDRWLSDLDFVLVYDYDPGKALDLMPFPMLHNIRRDFPAFKEAGLWGFWTEGQNAWMVNHLSYYVRAKLMWDVNADVDALVRDYCERFYGPAAEPLEEYIRLMEKAVDETNVHETYGRAIYWRPILNPVVDRLSALLADAEGRAAAEPYAQRVHVLRLVHDHMTAELDMENAAADGRFAEAVEHATRMFAYREEAEKIQTGLLPKTNELSANDSSSVETQQKAYQSMGDKAGGSVGELIMMLPREWEYITDPDDNGVLEQWYLPGKVEGWKPIDTTLYWELQGLADEKGMGYAGKVWYRTQIDVPADVKGKPLKLTFGGIFNRGIWLWVNGTMRYMEGGKKGKLGYFDSLVPIDAEVTDLIKPGETNTIAVLIDSEGGGRSMRGGIHRRAFMWSPKGQP